MENVSIKIIYDKILRHPLMQEVSLEAVVDYAVDLMRILGSSYLFSKKEAEIEIKDYRGVLPDDYISIIQASYKGQGMTTITASFYSDAKDKSLPQYKLQGKCIHTTFKEGVVKISYLGIDLDEDGYPTLPDDAIFLRALESYIKKQQFMILFDMGKINGQSLNIALQEYAFNVAQAQSRELSIDEMEGLSQFMLSNSTKNRHKNLFK